MDTQKIKAMLLAVEKGSLTAAATELGYTQSGMTHMMNSLDDEIGLKLLERNKTGVRLSAQGQELYEELRSLCELSEKIEQKAQEIKRRGFSTLRLGAYSSMARQWLPAIIAALRKACPDMEVSVTMFSMIDACYNAVKDGSLDCAIASRISRDYPGMSWVHLRNDPLVAVLPADYEFDGTAFPVENFDGLEFFMPAGGFELDIAPALAARESKGRAMIRYTNLDDASIASMVAHGLGVTVLSDLVMQSISDRVMALPLEPYAYRELGIIFGENRSNDKNVSRLIDCAKTTIDRMYAED